MTENKTRLTQVSAEDYLNAIPDESIRRDCWKIAGMMQAASGEPPRMWGESIVGFGSYHYKYGSGREGDWMLVGFSARKQNITLYLTGCLENHDPLLSQLGKFTHAKSCLYIKRLSDVHLPVLEELIRASVAYIRRTYPSNPA
ncbi:MAG TPA: DUF1801 domain-containing protein [Anaerolineales bacterium]